MVLDMHADFDVVLGMEWILEWNPMSDWKKLEFTVETSTETKRLRRLPTMPEVQVLANLIIDEVKMEFNLIDKKELKKALKKKGETEFVLYFAQEKQEQLNNIESEVTEIIVQDPELQKLLDEFRDVFRNELPDELPPQRAVDHEINTGNEASSNHNAYPLSIVQLQEQIKQIDALFKHGLIQESTSPWEAPILFVRKPKTSGEWRMCIDYRILNNKILKNAYPLSRIQDCLDRLGKTKHCTTLDLTFDYWQVRIANKDVMKTAFNTRYDKYEFLVMPFGLTNAPSTFQSLMNSILRPYIDRFVLMYLDDILIYSNSSEEHREYLRLILDALRRHKLYAKPSKCTFDQSKVEFCGHMIDGGVVRVLDKKIKIIRDWPVPKNVHEVRQFFDLTNYYRRFIHGFDSIAAPLAALFKQENSDKRKNRSIVWNIIHHIAFHQLKDTLTNAPVLHQSDSTKPYTIETDASDFAIDYALMQQGDDGLMHPVAFDDRKL